MTNNEATGTTTAPGACPRCERRVPPTRDLGSLRCFTCESDFFQAWPPAGTSGDLDYDAYRQRRDAARQRFMDATTRVYLPNVVVDLELDDIPLTPGDGHYWISREAEKRLVDRSMQATANLLPDRPFDERDTLEDVKTLAGV